MKRTRMTTFGVLIMVLALTVTGCGGAATNTATSKEKVLTVATNADAVTMDPQKTNDAASANVFQQIYNTLVDLTPDMKIKPSLATSWKQIDALTWQFDLRKGVKFQNGEELKASDVKFTFDRLLDPKNASPGSFVLNQVKETKVIDDYTVQVITKQPFAPILYNLTHVASSIINQKAVTEAGTNYGQNPIGTGPFKFVSWQKNSQINMVKFPDYWEGPAKLDKVVFRIIPENVTSIAELRSGGVDILFDLPPDQITQLANDKTITVDRAPSFTVRMLTFNNNEKPFNDPKVRQAVNYAINKEEIARVAYNGAADVATGPLSQAINFANKDLKGYPYDKAKAKALLAEAGYPNGLTTTLYLSNKDTDKKVATIIQAQLKEVGITTDQQVMEWGAFLDKTAKGTPMALLRWITVTGDADNGLYANFQSKNWGSGGNRSFYKNPQVDTLLDAGQTDVDPLKRAADYAKAQELIVQDAPWAFLDVEQSLIGVNKRVNGFINMPTRTYKLYSVSVQ